MDAVERADRERARANDAAVRELAVVCEAHDARCAYDPLVGIMVWTKHIVRVDWRWSHVSRGARIEVRGLGDSATHPHVSPADMARGLGAMAALLGDPLFTDALEIVLARVSPDSARALASYQQRHVRGDFGSGSISDTKGT